MGTGGGQLYDAQRATMWRFDPFQVVVIGKDTDDGPEHPLYSIVANSMTEADLEPMVQSLLSEGQLQPIGIVKWDDKPTVRIGNKRTLAMRIATKRREEMGLPPLLLSAVDASKGTNGQDHFIAKVTENNQRIEDPQIAKARSAVQYFKLYGDDPQTRKRFALAANMRVQDLDALLRVLENDELVGAVNEGTIAVTTSTHLAELPRAEQSEIITRAKSGEKITTDEARERKTVHKKKKKAAKRGEDTSDVVVRPSLPTIRKVLRAGTDQLPPDAYKALQWVLGECGPRSIVGLQPILTKIEKGVK